VATAVIHGITTRYEVVGTGPALLMFSPGGFDATLDKWSTQGIYARIRPVDHLSRHFTCIIFDRRETGESGGRVERITWADYAAQGVGLLDHLGITRAHVMGACMGCCPAMTVAVRYPERVSTLVLYWPVGGPRYRITGQLRFAQHLAFVQQEGLEAVVALAREGKSFGQDPRGGPWVAVIRRDTAFAETFARQDVEKYKWIVSSMGRTLIDRDTAPGAEPEDLLRLEVPALIVPGRDATHGTSAARYLEECLRGSEYWDAPVETQTAEAAPARILAFLGSSAPADVVMPN
jgi:pimeloyl-ACP methyl ester carboxylesterase